MNGDFGPFCPGVTRLASPGTQNKWVGGGFSPGCTQPSPEHPPDLPAPSLPSPAQPGPSRVSEPAQMPCEPGKPPEVLRPASSSSNRETCSVRNLEASHFL